jgi:excisionase family DNA binding protein
LIEKLVLYSPEQVAEITGVTRRTVYAWLTGGFLVGVKHGPRMWRIREADFKAFLEGRVLSSPQKSKPVAKSRKRRS